MRILISTLLLMGVCFAQQYDSKIITNDFKNQQQAKYTLDTLPTWEKQEVINKYLNLADISSHNVVCNNNTLSNPADYRCPKARDGYTTSLYAVNLAGTSMQCLLGKKGVLQKPLAIFTWTLNDFPSYNFNNFGEEFNPSSEKDDLANRVYRKIAGNNVGGGSCSNLFVENRKEAIIANKAAIEKSALDFSNLQQAKIGFSQKSEANGENVGIPHILVATIIGDNNMIDTQSSINHNTLVLKEGFKPFGANFLRAKIVTEVKNGDVENSPKDAYNLSFEAAGGFLKWGLNYGKAAAAKMAEHFNLQKYYDPNIRIQRLENISSEESQASSNIINYRLISMLEFFPKWSQLNSDLFTILASIIGLIMIGGYALSRTAQQMDEHTQDRNSSTLIFGGVLLASCIIFLPTSINQTVTIDGEKFKLTENNFNRIETSGFYTAIDFANNIARGVIDSEISSIIKRVGGIQTDNLISVFAQNQLYLKELAINGHWLKQCGSTYNIDFLKHYNNNKNYYFPPSEQWIYANYVFNGRIPNYYTPYADGGALRFDNQGSYPTLSMSFCNKVEKKYAYLAARYNSNLALISKASAGVDPIKLEMIENLIRSQYGMFQEWGFFSILSTPLITYKSQQMGKLFDPEEKDTASKLLDEERDSIAKKILYHSPMLLIPGANSLYQTIKDNAAAIIGSLGAAYGSSLPGAGTAGGALAGAAAGWLGSSTIAFTGTIYIVEEILKLVPIISIVMFGLLILMKIIIKILTYHLIAPFVIVVSFSKRNTQILTNFFSRVISIMLEIPIFVLSVWAAMSAHDLLISIGTPLSSTLMKIMGEITTDHAGSDFALLSHSLDFIAQGFIMVLLHLFSFVIVYKILSTYHTQIFEAVEVKSASAFDDVVEKMTQSAQGWGHRI